MCRKLNTFLILRIKLWHVTHHAIDTNNTSNSSCYVQLLLHLHLNKQTYDLHMADSKLMKESSSLTLKVGPEPYLEDVIQTWDLLTWASNQPPCNYPEQPDSPLKNIIFF